MPPLPVNFFSAVASNVAHALKIPQNGSREMKI